MAMRARWAGSFFLAVAACGSTRAQGARSASTVTPASPIDFQYDSVDEDPSRTLSAGRLRGRATVIAFLATYDVASQAQARFLTMVFRGHKPRLNAAAILLDPVENRPLLAAFGQALGLPYPLAIADRELIAGRGPFGDAHTVPTTVILDELGRLRWKHVGLAKDDEIERALSGL